MDAGLVRFMIAGFGKRHLLVRSISFSAAVVRLRAGRTLAPEPLNPKTSRYSNHVLTE